MSKHVLLIASAFALGLSACGGDDRPAADTSVTPPATTAPAAPSTVMAPAATMTMPAPATTTTMPAPATTSAAPAAASPPSDKPAAVVDNCATTIEGNDAMQYNVGSIAIPASCKQFKITLRHVGQMPVAAMGHNVVVARDADLQALAASGAQAGAAAGFLPAGDARVVAATRMIGGGETTDVTFDTSKLPAGGSYVFFCSFPGHAALMKGTITVG